MRTSGIVIAGVMMAGLMAGTVVAAEAGPINRREHRQVRRIVHGVRSGALTNREYLRLQRALNRASRHIYRQTHDRQRQ